MLRSFGYAARPLRPLGTWLIVATVATGLISLTACAEGCGPYSLGRYFSLLVDVVFALSRSCAPWGPLTNWRRSSRKLGAGSG